MRRRPARLVAAAAVVAIGLAGCTSVVTGNGATRGGTSPGASPASRDHDRLPLTSRVGDPITAEFCAGVALSAFGSAGGAVTFDDWQYPGGCGIDIGVSPSVYVDAQAVSPQEAAGTDRKWRGSDTIAGLEVFTYDDPTGGCEILVHADGFYVDVTASTYGRPAATAAYRCHVVTELARQVAAEVGTGVPPRRPAPKPTVTRFDYCALLEEVDLSTIPGSGVASAYESQDYGHFNLATECIVLTGTMSLSTFPVLVHSSDGLSGRTSFGGHRFRLTADGSEKRCRLASEQGAVGSGAARELIIIEADADTRATLTRTDLCRAAGFLGAALLNLAGLR
jgi:hypothetical protein